MSYKVGKVEECLYLSTRVTIEPEWIDRASEWRDWWAVNTVSHSVAVISLLGLLCNKLTRSDEREHKILDCVTNMLRIFLGSAGIGFVCCIYAGSLLRFDKHGRPCADGLEAEGLFMVVYLIF